MSNITHFSYGKHKQKSVKCFEEVPVKYKALPFAILNKKLDIENIFWTLHMFDRWDSWEIRDAEISLLTRRLSMAAQNINRIIKLKAGIRDNMCNGKERVVGIDSFKIPYYL